MSKYPKRETGPTPEEEFWQNTTLSVLWLCHVVLLLFCVYATQPAVVTEMIRWALEVLK